MGKIVLLDELTANKIAAGEVVERPASVVKELIENAIDAGSTLLEITVTDGGLTDISVLDNGSGMDANDARMAFERHATSKIRSAEDLTLIETLGFRGEALPSIASVSKVLVKTRTPDAIAGTEVVMEGGRLVQVTETGCRAGTTVKVSELFFNTPARRKHLKKPGVEAGHIGDVISKFALGYPNISFQYSHNGRLLLKTSGRGDLLESIISVYGLETSKEMIPLKWADGQASVTGFIGKPSLSRAARHHQIIYLNGRFVSSRTISEAVEAAYHTLMMTGRFPVFVINLTVEPTQIDVNVHPAKTEVRLADPAGLANFITKAVLETLLEKRLIPAPQERTGSLLRKQPESPSEKPVQTQWRTPDFGDKPRDLPQSEPSHQIEGERPGQAHQNDAALRINDAATLVQNEGTGELKEDNVQYGQEGFPDLYPVGQIDNTYIICQGPDGMYIVDQHAAHERILYEKYMARPESFTAVEQLLFPVTFHLTHQEAEIFRDHQDAFQDLGFVVEAFGGNAWLLRGVPAGTSKIGSQEIFLDLLDYFSQNRYKISGKALRENLIITAACKSAIKAHDKMSLPEMEAILEQLAAAAQPYTCPHGRPTLIYFSGYDLEKKFKRVV